MKKSAVVLSIVLSSLVATTAFAEEAKPAEAPKAAEPTTLEGVFKGGTTAGYVRAGYVSDIYKNHLNQADQQAFGIGGMLSYETAPYMGFSAGTAFYTTNDLGLNDSKKNKIEPTVQNRFFDDEQNGGYSLLGQAYVKYAFGKTMIKYGRQQIDSPLAGSDDARIIPNLFEGWLVTNTDLPDTTLVAAHLSRFSGWDSWGNSSRKFISMSNAAGVKDAVGDKPVSAVAAVYAGIPNTTVQLWDYYAWDVLNAVYADAIYSKKVNATTTATLAAQAYNFNNIGKLKTYLSDNKAGSIKTTGYGFKAAAAHEPSGVTATISYNGYSENKDSGGAIMVNGRWGGYPDFSGMDDLSAVSSYGNINGGSIARAALDLNLGAYGLGDRVITVAYASADYKNKYNDGVNLDANVWNIIYTCNGALMKNLNARAVFENRVRKTNIGLNQTAGFDLTRTANTFKIIFAYNF